ncbi:hypothetical protein ACJRO7_030259 [Eucalyptus globulus]|uniref:Uncharacterized protein n=1 Tax=Eucalyptus globulus TaxID=34317 RepID=A0ABD3JDU0_EUCGL
MGSSHFWACNSLGLLHIGVNPANRLHLIETRRSGITPSGPQTAHNDPWFSGHGHDFSNELTRERGTTDAEEKLPTAIKEEFLIQKNGI